METMKAAVMGDEQCDQIGRIFAYWANFRLLGECFHWAVFNVTLVGQKFQGTFCKGKSYVLILTKNGLGYNSGNYFTNSSGRPGDEPV
jgi:hypothetical protein